jgi:hypothetical protein
MHLLRWKPMDPLGDRNPHTARIIGDESMAPWGQIDGRGGKDGNCTAIARISDKRSAIMNGSAADDKE